MSKNDKKFKTREAWLEAAADLLEQDYLQPVIYDEQGRHDLIQPSCKFSIMQPTQGKIENAEKGMITPRENSTADLTEIHLTPYEDNPVQMLVYLMHELIHAYMNAPKDHGAVFQAIAKGCGLVKPFTAPHASDDLLDALAYLADELGYYPHEKVKESAKPKDTGRNLRMVCLSCDFKAYASTKQLERLPLDTPTGRAVCPCCFDNEMIHALHPEFPAWVERMNAEKERKAAEKAAA